ncbi:MAG: ribonuclease HIII [Firmicutes bacterium]|nr:ribonuclease HIII [Bacillota bacterium]
MNNIILIPKTKISEVGDILLKSGFICIDIPYGFMYRLDDSVITIYHSGKVLFQGKNFDRYFKIIEKFAVTGRKIDTSPNQNNLDSEKEAKIQVKCPRIGTDESGKGDFFGPLVTAAFYLNSKETEEKLVQLGVTDSKKLSDSRVKELATEIKKLGPYEVVRIGPQKYNELYEKMQNINQILAWSHARAIENLLLKHECDLVVSDQFGEKSLIENSLFKLGKKVDLIQMHKAEQDMAVAAASILARSEFIHSIESLTKKINFALPFGAGEQVINAAVKIVKEKEIGFLRNIAKVHFKTYIEVKNRIN